MFGGVASTWGQRYAEAVFQPACSSWLLCTGDDYIAEPGIPDVGEEQQKEVLNIREYGRYLLICLVLLAAYGIGILAECYVNPVFMGLLGKT